MTREELAERLREIESDPWVPLRDLCMMLRASIKPARICVASGRGHVLEFAPRQAVPLPRVDVVKPEPVQKATWAEILVACAGELWRQRAMPISKITLRPRPMIDEWTRPRRVK
jgi:hypothetical protein